MADAALCAGLGQSRDRLKFAMRPDSDFPDQVSAAFEGQGSGEVTAADYLTRGRELLQLTDAVANQCQGTFGYGATGASASEQAAIRRRSHGAKKTADLYLEVPAAIRRIDAEGGASARLRPAFLQAMYKIADGPDYAAAQALADPAEAELRRIRR